jgi:hypothetical protein
VAKVIEMQEELTPEHPWTILFEDGQSVTVNASWGPGFWGRIVTELNRLGFPTTKQDWPKGHPLNAWSSFEEYDYFWTDLLMKTS